MAQQKASGNYSNPYLFNGKELDEETGLYYYGARYYNPRYSVWLGVDPMVEKGTFLSPYVYCFNNPVKLVDFDGLWPGVTTIFTQGNIGAGLGFGLYAIQQSGISYDSYGKTHFTMTGTAYIVNQNLDEGSLNPKFILGADVGLSFGVTQDWSSDSFIESIGNPNQISVPSATIKGSLGVGLAANKKSASLSLGLQAGAMFNTMGMTIDESISLTRSEATKVSKMTDVLTESWTVRNISPIKDKDGHTSGYTGYVFTKNKKEEFINTGIKVNSGTVSNGKVISSNNVWISPNYQKSLDEDK